MYYNQLNNTTLLNVPILCYKDNNSIYFPDGVPRMINANHQKEGIYGVTLSGHTYPLPTSTSIPPDTSSPPTQTDFEQATAFQTGNNTYSTPYPLPVTDPNFKICVRVKDMTTQITYYLDQADYDAQVAKFNPIPYTTT